MIITDLEAKAADIRCKVFRTTLALVVLAKMTIYQSLAK